MRMLGIDPGFGRVGWGVVEENKGKVTVVSYGVIETDAKSEMASRLQKVFTGMQQIIATNTPDEVAIEELFFGANTKTAISVAQGRGVIMLAAVEKGIPLFEYTPLQVKVAITGYGKADKKQLALLVKTLLKLTEMPKIDDTTDALAIALTHVFSRKMNAL